jgi:predicted AAA+ superfamily ATPase
MSEFLKENLLSAQPGNLYFWHSRSGSEVDLVITKSEKISAYEIKWKKRKISNRAFSEKYGVPVQIFDSSNPFVTDN